MSRNDTVWADPNTLRGKIERIVEPIIGGGADETEVAGVVDAVLRVIASERKEYVYEQSGYCG